MTDRFATPGGSPFTKVEDIAFAVEPGAFVSPVGPPGCRKFAILGMVSGLLPPSYREVLPVPFITHDLEEATALSDHIVVLTASPGRVKASYETTLSRPLQVTEVRCYPAFAGLYKTIWKDLKDEVHASHERSKRRPCC